MTARLIVWLALQLLVIGVVVLRIPLSAHYPQPAESLALHLLLSAQVVGVSMLFPFLLRDARAAMQIIATALPFQVAATFLVGREIREVVQAIAFVDAWIVTLAIWSNMLGRARLLPSRTLLEKHAPGSAGASPSRALAIGVVVATCLTLGGGVLHYLRLEFAPDAPGVPFESISPLLTTVASLDHSTPLKGWLFLAILALAGVVAALGQWHRARTVIHATTYPPSSPHPTAG